ncbi:hypothetical protein HQ529_02230 [Candidatus Woesearchaeota archaeon]|nr:hypothetical protein [Candidatus Woesearchaeota archaeon]
MKKASARSFLGFFFILIGIYFVFKIMGVVNLSVWSGFKTFWPIGVILAGIALLFKSRFMAFVFLLITVLIGAVYVTDMFEVGDLRKTNLEVPALEGDKTVDLLLNYGAGNMDIRKGDEYYLISNIIETNDKEDPTLEYERTGSDVDIFMGRQGGVAVWKQIKDSWDITLSPNIVYDVEIDYGAADMNFNMTGLVVKNLQIDSGATSTKLLFSNYPTKAQIATGASTLNLMFPEGSGVMIDVDGGAISTNFNGFSKKDGVYYSDDYESDKSNIEIKIDAGASTINAGFY